MAKPRRVLTFHGAFATKTAAKRKQAQGSGRVVRRVVIRGRVRYLVASRRK